MSSIQRLIRPARLACSSHPSSDSHISPFATVQDVCRTESGATSVEYAVMLALILMTLIVGVRSVGNSTGGMWANNNEKLQSVGF